MTPGDRQLDETHEDLDRRSILAGMARLAVGGLAVGGGLVGCASSVRQVARPMPDLPESAPLRTPSRTVVTARPDAKTLPGVLARRTWTTAQPTTRSMRRNPGRLSDITIHHDGLGTPLATSSERASKARLDLIRRAHVGKGWSDIGYHFAIDRGGRVWQCRPLEWEGAHVRSHNPGNIGILVMGNFEIERPTRQQLDALNSFVNMSRRTYGISVARVRTHREWQGAATSCPGKYLQPQVLAMRSRSFRVA